MTPPPEAEAELTREDRRSLHLHAAIAGKLRADPAAVLALARANIAKKRAVNPNAEQLLTEWEAILDRPVTDIAAVLADPRPTPGSCAI